jgi:hypothetical protein
MDSNYYVKRSLHEGYKSNRAKGVTSSFITTLKTIAPHLSFHYWCQAQGYEADDLAYNLCKKLNSCVLMSNDIDWIINLTANDNIRIVNGKETIHQSNFYLKYKFPIHKIPLYLFLLGDSKDSVKKPFRIKGDIVENVNNHESVEDYCKKNDILTEDVKLYKQLIYPFTGIEIDILKGKKTPHTRDIITKYKLEFLRSYLSKKKRLL